MFLQLEPQADERAGDGFRTRIEEAGQARRELCLRRRHNAVEELANASGGRGVHGANLQLPAADR